jgi:enamine deaminase RidA (YjgF/YER057c/UK114 family)
MVGCWQAHVLFFKDINPATTLIQVSRLIEPQLLVEIEVTAICAG